MTTPQSVVVPVEPTDEMMLAGALVGPDTNNGQFGYDDARTVFVAMLAAAPAPSSLAGGEVLDAAREMLALVLLKYGNLDADVNQAVERAQSAILAALSPEAREGEAVAWRSRQRIMSYSGQPGVWNYGESRTLPDDDPVYENQPLYTHPAAPSADKLRTALTSIREQVKTADDPDHHTLGLIEQIALAALKAEGA